MKKISSVICLSFVVIFLLVVSLSSICFSEENIDRWVLYGKSPFGDYYYDKMSVTKGSKNIIRVWEKVKFTKEGKDSQTKDRKYSKIPKYEWDKLDFGINLYEFDCENNTRRLLSFVDYNDEERIIEKFNVANPEIEPVIPGSINESLLKSVCK